MAGRTKYCCALLLLSLTPCIAFSLRYDEPSTENLFAESVFDHWRGESPRESIQWEVRVLPPRLSLHQRLEVGIAVRVPGVEVVKRHNDGRLIMLLEITDAAGRRFRNHQTLELGEIKPELANRDV